jgi:hypothetical protein
MQQLVTKDPDNAEWQQDLAELHCETADAAKAASDIAEARAECKACALIAGPIASSPDPSNKNLGKVAADCQSAGSQGKP